MNRPVLIAVTMLLAACGGGGDGYGGGSSSASAGSGSGGGYGGMSYTVGGTVSGLTGTVVLQDNGADNLSISANGAFMFRTPLNGGMEYAVTVLTQPMGQTCTVGNGMGTYMSMPIANVMVTCH